MAKRLRKVIHLVISENQSSFIKGRQILDGILIVDEIVEETKLLKKKGVMFKVDFEKAYDSVSWDFLNFVMEKMGFSNVWRKWISECLSSASVSVLVNGSAMEEFRMSQG